MSNHSGRMQMAARKAVDCYSRAERVAKSLEDELEDVTPIQGVPVTNLSEEDSAVIAVGLAITANEAAQVEPVPKKRAATSPGEYGGRPRSTGK